MMKEYKLAKGWAIFIYLTAPLLIVVFGYLLLMPFLPGAKAPKAMQLYWFFAPLSLGMLAVFSIGLINTWIGRFVIAADRVFTKGIFSNRQLLFEQIKGYRTDGMYIFIVPAAKGLKQIKVSHYFSGANEIVAWLAANFPNLDVQQEADEEEAMLANEALGCTVEEREAQVLKARGRARTLNTAGGLVAASTCFWPQPYEAVVFACLLLPVICVLVSRTSNRLIRIEERRSKAYPSVFVSLFFPSLAICIRALLDFHLLRYGNVWKGTLLFAALLMALLLVKNKAFVFQQVKTYATLAGLAVLSLAYGYGATLTLNSIFDQSAVSVYHAQVLSKRVQSGKTTTYYLSLSPWGPQKKVDDIAVQRSLYSRLQVNDDVSIYLRQGRFAIPWFVVTD